MSAPETHSPVVKPLEWAKTGSDPDTFFCPTSIGNYHVCGSSYGLFQLYRNGFTKTYVHGSENECKVAAQADYERRILSALSVDVAALAARVAELEAANARLKAFVGSFHFTVTDSFYKDAYLHLVEPDSVSFRLGNGSQFSGFIAKLEERRAALNQGGGNNG